MLEKLAVDAAVCFIYVFGSFLIVFIGMGVANLFTKLLFKKPLFRLMNELLERI